MDHAIEPFTQTGQAAWIGLRSLWDIQAGFLRKSAYLQFSLVTLGFESGLRQWQLFHALAERDALIAGQKEIADAFQPRLSAIVREAASAAHASSEEFMAWTFGAFVPRGEIRPATRRPSKAAARRTPRKKSA